MMAAVTVAGDAVGFVSRNNAATPVTCGVAIDVPEIVLVAVSLVLHADVMLLPGAKMSRHVPKFENDERASVVVVEPTGNRTRHTSRGSVTGILILIARCNRVSH